MDINSDRSQGVAGFRVQPPVSGRVSMQTHERARGGRTSCAQNIETMVAVQRREWSQTSISQKRVERVSRFVGRPAYLIAILVCALVWILWNISAPGLAVTPFDRVPFSILQGLLTLTALLTTTIVLIAQNRQTKLEQQHSHLDLQVNLLTEQKVTKLIHLIEELRKDLPMVRDRHDPQAQAMTQPGNPKSAF